MPPWCGEKGKGCKEHLIICLLEKNWYQKGSFSFKALFGATWVTLYELKLLFNSLPNNIFLDWSKLKAFADDKMKVTKKMKFVSKWWKILRKKEKMLVTSIFSFSHNIFKKLHFQGCLKSGLCGKELIVDTKCHNNVMVEYKACNSLRILTKCQNICVFLKREDSEEHLSCLLECVGNCARDILWTMI